MSPNRPPPPKPCHVLSFFLYLAVVLVLIAQLVKGNYQNSFLCLLTLVLFALPSLFQRKLHIVLPNTLEVLLLLFIFASEILGEIQAFYLRFPQWDIMLHTLNGFLCAAIGFALVDLLNREQSLSIRLSPLYLSVAAFCFSMTIGVIWELFEFGMDCFFDLDMQKDTILSSVRLGAPLDDIREVILVLADGTRRPLGVGGYPEPGLVDTMGDLLVNLVGATVFSVIGFYYVRHRGRVSFASRFIPRVLSRKKKEHRAE